MLGRTNGLYSLGRLRGEVDRLFKDFLDVPLSSSLFGSGSEEGFPVINIWEDESSFHAEAELPGMKLEDLEIYVVGNQLTIRGERKSEAPKDATVHRTERTYGSFSRVVRLPTEIDAAKVQASFRDGLLTLTLAKAESAKPRKVKVVAQ